jgi:tetratricopeptide (TPR) repeat protein
MATDPAALERVRNYYQAGDPARAAQACRDLLPSDPGNADLWCLLGVSLRATGDPEQALASYREALRLRPNFLEAWNNLGNVLVTQGKLDEAIAAFEQVLRLRPHYPEALNNLGAALRHKGQWAEAAARYQQALSLKPDYPDAHNNLGDALQGLNRLEEAAASYRRALQLRPAFPEALTNLGNVLVRLERVDEAMACHREALRVRPGFADAYTNLGNALVVQRRYDEAEACYREALRLRPYNAEAHHNLGTALAEQGKLEEAVSCYRTAMRIRPDYIDACGNLATALLALGRPDEALAAHDLVLEYKPDSPEAHMSRALALLLLGYWEQGWPEYEWRWRTPEFGSLPYTQPLWDGSDLRGRTILLHAEQGLGDTLMALRYAPLVRQRGGKVVVAPPKALMRLLARSPGIDHLAEPGSPLPAIDCHAPLLSLPGIFRTTSATVPADVPYVFADPGLIEHWRRELDRLVADSPPARPTFKVGIAWQGNPQFKGDRQRSIPLVRYAPLAAVEGVRLLSLQKGFGTEQLRDISFPVVELAARLDEASGPFMDTAAVMKNLDLVVTSDTATAHLAGALGVRAWVVLPFSPHWHWLLAREDSPWYPTVRLFRQKAWGDWEGVFARLAAELARVAAQPRSARPILVETAPGELLDKITILEIKSSRLADAAKLANVRRELAVLSAARDEAVPPSAELERLTAELRGVNEALWDVEDELRRCEREQDFGARFIELARSVYQTNDRRSAIKRGINDLLGSSLKEEKSYGPPP